MLQKYSGNKCKIADIDIYYIDEGKGFPIVLLHGFPQTSHLWRYVIPELKKNYRVIAPDLRGMGDSQFCSIGQDKKTLASDVIQLITSLDIDKCLVVGHDWGGAVAQRIALEYPNYLSGMMSMGIPYMPAAKIEELANPKQIFNNWYFFFHQIKNLPEIFINKAGKEYIKWMMEFGSSKKEMPFCPDTLEVYANAFCNMDRTPAYLNLYRTLFDQDPKDWKPFINKIINVPTLWIVAADDPFVPPHMSENISEKFTNIQIKTFKECGHWIPEEQSLACIDAIQEFANTLKKESFY